MSPYQQAEDSARKHGYDSYNHYLESDHWTGLKSALSMQACCACGSTRRLLAHHIRYRDLIDVQVSDLAAMCSECHDIYHIGCRLNKVTYVGVEPSEISIRVKQYRTEPWFLKRVVKLQKRKARKLGKLLRRRRRKPTRLSPKRKQRSEKREGNFLLCNDRMVYNPKI